MKGKVLDQLQQEITNAYQEGNIDFVKILLEQAITNAYQEGNTDAMKTFLEQAIDIACQEGDVKTTMKRLGQAIKIDYQDDNIEAIIQLLDRANNNPNVQFEEGHTYLDQAAFWHSLEAVELLLDQAIKIAYKVGNVDVIKQLLDQVNDFNIQFEEGHTYLHKAAFWDSAEAVELLVQNGEEINNTVLQAAFSWNSRKVINKLLEYGADINISDSNGLTVLTWVTGETYPTSDEESKVEIKLNGDDSAFSEDM